MKEMDEFSIQAVVPVGSIVTKLLDIAAQKDLVLKDMLRGWIEDRMYVEMTLNTPDPPR